MLTPVFVESMNNTAASCAVSIGIYCNAPRGGELVCLWQIKPSSAFGGLNDMADKLDDFLERLQDQINAEARAAYGDKGFERWQNPLYRGALENPDGYARITGSCGDTMQLFLRFENDRVKEATFQTDGCGSSTVCGSFAAELALGKNPDQLAAVTGETILDMLGDLPEEDVHCAYLAAETLQAALDNYMKKRIRRIDE